MKIETLDAEMRYQFSETHKRVDGIAMRLDKFEKRFDQQSVVLSELDRRFAKQSVELAQQLMSLKSQLSEDLARLVAVSIDKQTRDLSDFLNPFFKV